MILNPLRTTIIAAAAVITLLSLNVSAQIVFTMGSDYRYLKGVDAIDLPNDWFEPDFDDSAWPSSMALFHYGDGTGGAELTDMQGSYSTLFLHSTFSALQLDMISRLTLGVSWDDGFIIWINGTQVLSQLAQETITYDALANGNHESGLAESFLPW